MNKPDLSKLRTLKVILAAMRLSIADMKSREGLEAFFEDALIVLPEYARETLMEMDFAEFILLLQERCAMIGGDVSVSIDGLAAVSAAQNLLGDDDE